MLQPPLKAVELGLVAKIPEGIPAIGDKNYYPERGIATPHRACRDRPLLPDQNLANRYFVYTGGAHSLEWPEEICGKEDIPL